MHRQLPVSRVVDLLDPSANTLFGISVEEARAIVSGGDTDEIQEIDGHFALVGQEGKTVRLARTIGKIMRYFVAKLEAGPALVVADRIDAIKQWMIVNGLGDQFHPSYTRMVPAHYLVEIRLVGCPDPNPEYHRFFAPQRETLPPEMDSIGTQYVSAVREEIAKWIRSIPVDESIGVCFSGGVDSGAVFLLTYHVMLESGMNPARLKAFTLNVDQGAQDAEQARSFLSQMDLSLFLEEVSAAREDINIADAVRVMEDYKPLDVQACAALLTLCRGIRNRYPNWRYLIDGDGGDENLKDYPIEENPELTINSVLNNRMLYQEGWGVDSIKHSLTYTGGQSRGYARTYAPTRSLGFSGFSPFVAPSVIKIAEGIPFADLTGRDHQRLYALKGDLVARGINGVTGWDMPVFEKRRFQNGAVDKVQFDDLFPSDQQKYREMFQTLHA